MAPPRVSRELLQQALDALADADGNQTEAARRLNLERTNYRHRLEAARMEGLVAHTPNRGKPRIRVPARAVYTPAPDAYGPSIRVFCFGCAHDAPNLPDKSRFRYAGLLASELKPDYIVDLGDSLDLDSLSLHAPPGSVDYQERPFFKAEIASLTDAFASFHETAPSPETVPRYHLHGNHENRAWRHEANNPTSQGIFTTEIDQVFARMGWTIRSFREWLFLGGVGFTHAPINGVGKEVAGKFPDQAVAQEATHSVVWSHTHKSVKVNRPKFGIGNAIQVFNTGSFMPMGYIKKYAGMSLTGWTYGVHELTLRDGQIESTRTWSTRELEERYA